MSSGWEPTGSCRLMIAATTMSSGLQMHHKSRHGAQTDLASNTFLSNTSNLRLNVEHMSPLHSVSAMMRGHVQETEHYVGPVRLFSRPLSSSSSTCRSSSASSSSSSSSRSAAGLRRRRRGGSGSSLSGPRAACQRAHCVVTSEG